MEGAEGGAQASSARVMETVKTLKVVLDNCSTTSREEVLAALEQLSCLGSLPTEVLKETLVGKALHSMAKSVEDPMIKAKAKSLELAWRQDFKKRKASTDDLSLRRCSSNVSEGTSPGLSLSRTFSQELEIESIAPQAQPASQALPALQAQPATQAPANGKAQRPAEASNASASAAASASSGSAPAAASVQEAKKDDPYRDKVRAKLVEVLSGEYWVGGDSDGRDPAKLAEEIEEELAKALPKKEAYMNQARSILFNLKDSKNPSFKFKVYVGFFKPQQLPTLTAEDMASEQKNDERRKQRKYAMEALDQGWALKNGQQPTTGMFTCGKCKQNKTTYFQMQTRSSDEPMTTFVTCLTCNNRWKFC